VALGGFDPDILKDFLTESGELLDQLEGDLVSLESSPSDPALLNQVFRALHTIKGSASFLQLTNLVSVAHAAESALNAARNGQIIVDRPMMDRLLEAVDTIKGHMAALTEGHDLAEPSKALVATLTAYGEGRQSLSESDAAPEVAASAPLASAAILHAAASAADSPSVASTTSVAVATAPQAPRAATPSRAAASSRDLDLGPGKADLFDYLIADVEQSVAKIAETAPLIAAQSTRPAAANALVDLGDQLAKAVEFFELESMGEIARVIERVGQQAASLADDAAALVASQLSIVSTQLVAHTDALKAKKALTDPVTPLIDAVESALRGIAPSDDPQPVDDPSASTNPADPALLAPSPTFDPSAQDKPARDQPASDHPASDKPAAERADKPSADKHAADKAESTIRVEVGRLEALMNLVGELVLQKNRIAAITRRVSTSPSVEHELAEACALAAGGLDRVTGDIQLAVMRTRMQPLEKLFGKYPRLIRDLAAKTGKKMQLLVEGGDTEVDKSVLEALGDPLVHLLRNSADHGIDSPEERAKAGKSDVGTIFLRARHEGSHVRVQVGDDGRGLSREKISAKAVERGLVSRDAVAQLSDREIYRFIFEAGFSTAEKVSDLSGRGVGMDVVKTNIENLKGTIDLDSTPGQGTTVSITIPLTVAILPAMLVGVANEIYAIPLGTIVEIVKPDEAKVSSIGGHPVLNLRDSVLPLVSASHAFDLPPQDPPASEDFAVILSVNSRRIGLMVTRLIGQQEIVIKPLENTSPSHRRRAVSGATVRDDGGVSLIVDVSELIRVAERTPADARAA
jgi:two-component system chemotaxis sensor kinase CheA